MPGQREYSQCSWLAVWDWVKAQLAKLKLDNVAEPDEISTSILKTWRNQLCVEHLFNFNLK